MAVAGTPVYMSPEQARAEHDRPSTRSDVYRWVPPCTRCCQRLPYSGTNSRDVLEQISAARPLSRSHAPSLPGFSMMRPAEPEPEPEGRILPCAHGYLRNGDGP